MLMTPLFLKSELIGFFSIDDCKRERFFSDGEIEMVETTAVMLASYFNQIEQVRRDAQQDALLLELNSKLEDALGEALKAGRAKSDFLSVMSHEMRTPLSAIIGMTALGLPARELAKKNNALQKIDQASKYLLGIVNNVLEMSKIELIASEFCLREMVKKIESVVGISMAKKTIRRKAG
ncbi:MAG: hypothetical protein FWF59_11790 [Turicibacter sp.]|nr:hypothetical protein [Turicibacter sp.]